MEIKSRRQLKLGQKYYYAEVYNPKLEHQEDCIAVFECEYNDFTEERIKEYGSANKENLIKTLGVIAWAGRNKPYDRVSYMEEGWLEHKQFYTTANEAYRDAIRFTFSYYEQFKQE